MAIFDEWTRLSTRIQGLTKTSELVNSLFARNSDCLGAMVELGKTVAAIVSDLATFRALLSASRGDVAARIEAAESKAREQLNAHPRLHRRDSLAPFCGRKRAAWPGDLAGVFDEPFRKRCQRTILHGDDTNRRGR